MLFTMKPYSTDLPERLLAAHPAGMLRSEIIGLFQVNRAVVPAGYDDGGRPA
jgi:hypothetical protein